MKNSILLFTLIITTVGYSQIKKIDVQEPELIGQIAPMGNLHIKCEKTGDTYTFTYSDVTYQHIDEYKSFSFKDVDNAFDNLYEMIIKGFEEGPEENTMIEIPDGFLWLDYTKSLGVVNFRFQHSPGSSGEITGYSIWLTKKKLNKLFGK